MALVQSAEVNYDCFFLKEFEKVSNVLLTKKKTVDHLYPHLFVKPHPFKNLFLCYQLLPNSGVKFLLSM